MRVSLVTGGGRGIGRAIAIALAGPDTCVAIAGRTRSELERLLGFFVNTLVLRTRVDNNPTFRELLAQVRSTTLEAYEHQDLPFEKLVDHLKPHRSTSYSPLFQVMVAMDNAPEGDLALAGLRLTPTDCVIQCAMVRLDF